MDIANFALPFLGIFAVSFVINAVFVLTRSMHMKHTTRSGDTNAVQSAHAAPTPRIGGLGVVAAMAVAIFVFYPGEGSGPALLFALSFLPVMGTGLIEDLGYHMSPMRRLAAAAASSLVMVAGATVWITSTGVMGIDWLLGFTAFAIVFTVFWATGLCHAFNLIDGVNGLSAMTGCLIAAGLGAIASLSGQPLLAGLSFAMVPALLGFLLLNWPLGKIFLGDAGAYSIGHALAWIGILVAAASPQVAGVSIALLFFWPVADTFFAIYRRQRAGKRADQPDRLHFHQLVMRGLEIVFLGRERRTLANALTAVVLAPAVAAPVLVAVLTWNSPYLALTAIFVFATLFVGAYFWGVWFVRTKFQDGSSGPRGASRRRGAPSPLSAGAFGEAATVNARDKARAKAATEQAEEASAATPNQPMPSHNTKQNGRYLH